MKHLITLVLLIALAVGCSKNPVAVPEATSGGYTDLVGCGISVATIDISDNLLTITAVPVWYSDWVGIVDNCTADFVLSVGATDYTHTMTATGLILTCPVTSFEYWPTGGAIDIVLTFTGKETFYSLPVESILTVE